MAYEITGSGPTVVLIGAGPPTTPTGMWPWPSRATCRRNPGVPVRALPRERELARPGLWNDWKELL
jgi:hypothetical protein